MDIIYRTILDQWWLFFRYPEIPGLYLLYRLIRC